MNGAAPNIAAAIASVRTQEPQPRLLASGLVDPVSLLTPTQLKRMKMAQVYKGRDLHHLHDDGVIQMRPKGPRVLMYAILPEDATAYSAMIEYDARKAIAHVVIDVGTGVERHLDKQGWPDDARDQRTLRQRLRCWVQGRGVDWGSRPRPGDHLYVLSTAADRASKEDKTCRYWYAHVDDLSGGWEVPSPESAPAQPDEEPPAPAAAAPQR